MKPLHGALLFTFLGIAIWLLGERSDQQQLVSVSTGDNTSPAEVDLPATGTDIISVPELAALKTFRGAAIDGSLRVDKAGHLIIDLDLRHWIDFHLAATGEIPLITTIEIMRSQIATLPQPGENQAEVILDNYLGYLDALQSYDTEQQKRVVEPSMEEMISRTHWQQRLRKEWFELDVLTAFFEADEILDNYTVARLRLAKEGATEAELAQLEEKLPLAVRVMRRESRKLVDLEQAETELKNQGLSAVELDHWRRNEYGEEVADRLSDIDQHQNVWTHRLNKYKSYQKTLSLDGLSESDRYKLLQSYRDANFSLLEQKRLNAALHLLAEGE